MRAASTSPGREEARDLIALRSPPLDSHKGTFGKVLVGAGSRFMPGAAVLAATAAYRGGAGLVTILTDTTLIPVICQAVTEAIFTDWSAIGETLALGAPLGQDAILVGPGLGTRDRGRLVIDLISRADCPLVVDADALNLLAETPDPNLPPRDDRVWTPHPGEFHRLTGESPQGDEERVAAAGRFVEKRGGVLILKGHRSVIMSRDKYRINETGNPGLSTAGTGDVLAGVVTALLGQGYAPFDAACLATHFHGLAGDLAADELGPLSVMAGDLLEFLPEAILSHPVGK